MDKKVTYKILSEFKLIIEFLFGEIIYSDVINLKKNETQSEIYNPSFNIITVMKDSEFNVTDTEIDKFVVALKENNNILGNRKVALLTNTPHQVVIGMMYSIAARKLPINFKIVSTIEAAMDWVDLPVEAKLLVDTTIEDFYKNL